MINLKSIKMIVEYLFQPKTTPKLENVKQVKKCPNLR